MAYRILSAAVVACLAGLSATDASAQQDLHAQGYRIASAEQMIDRLTTKIARSYVVCDEFSIKAWMPRLSEACTAAVRQATPMLTTIRQVAERGDPVEWAKLVDHVHKFEAEIEGPLYSSERNK